MNKRGARVLAVGACATAVLSWGGCGDDGGGGGDDTTGAGKNGSLNVGLVFASTGAVAQAELYQRVAEHAASQVADAGGVGNGRTIRLVRGIDTETNAARAGMSAEQLLKQEKDVIGLIAVSGPEVFFRAGAEPPVGAGIAAAANSVPLLCTTCISPDFGAPGNQAAMGATVTGGDPADITAGTIEKNGFVFRLTEDTNAQAQLLAQKLKSDSSIGSVAGALLANINSGSEFANRFKDAFGDKYLGTMADSFPFPPPYSAQDWGKLLEAFRDGKTGPTNPHPACAAGAPIACNDFEGRGTAQPDAMAVYLIDQAPFLEALTAVYPDPSKRPTLRFSFLGYGFQLSMPLLDAMNNQQGISYVPRDDKDTEAFLADLKDRNVNLQLAQPTPLGTYDAVIVLALAAHITGKDVPTGEEVRDAMLLLNDPAGEKIGYGQFARAKEILDGGGTINYEGLIGSLDWDVAGGVKSPYGFWKAQKDGDTLNFPITERVKSPF